MKTFDKIKNKQKDLLRQFEENLQKNFDKLMKNVEDENALSLEDDSLLEEKSGFKNRAEHFNNRKNSREEIYREKSLGNS